MARKKIVFIIVEGPSDSQALAILFNKIFSSDSVHVHVTHGDITTRNDITSQNIFAKIIIEDNRVLNQHIFTPKNQLLSADFFVFSCSKLVFHCWIKYYGSKPPWELIFMPIASFEVPAYLIITTFQSTKYIKMTGTRMAHIHIVPHSDKEENSFDIRELSSFSDLCWKS